MKPHKCGIFGAWVDKFSFTETQNKAGEKIS